MMLDITIGLVSLLVGIAAGAYGWRWKVLREVVPVVVPPPVHTEQVVTIRYVSAQGAIVGEQQIPTRQRRPSRRFGAGCFAVSHRAADGAWVYRHCHDEREA